VPVTLVSVVWPDQLVFAAASTTSYGYNGDGLRMCKYAGSSNQPCQQGGATQFLWDVAGSLPLLLKDGSTAYIYGPDGLPVEQVNTSATYWYHHDQIGSTRLITDSTGASQATYTYDPYGGIASSTGSITNPFRYCGQYLDSESGFYYLRARFYDPSTAELTSMDPAVRSTWHPYQYVNGSPLNASDPTGLWCAGWTVGGIGFGGSQGSSTEWSVGYCGNGDLYASKTSGTYSGGHGNGVWGTYVSAGFGVQASGSATCAADLGNKFHRDYAGAGVGPASGSLSSSTGAGVHGNPVDVEEASYPTKYAPPSVGGGAGIISYDTYTNVVSTNWVATEVNDPLVAAASAVHSAATWVSSLW
jgi:RHS repeat-associated protein